MTELLNAAPTSHSTSNARSRASSAVALGLVSALGLCGAVPELLIMATSSPPDHGWLWPYSVTVFSGAMYAVLIACGRRRVYELSFWLFGYLFLGLAPLVQLRNQVIPSTTPGLLVALNRTTFVAIWLGLITFALGASTTSKHAHKQVQAQRLNEHRVIVTSLCCLTMSTYYVLKVGPGNLFLNRDEFNELGVSIWPNPATHAIITSLGAMSLLAPLAALTRARRQCDPRRKLLFTTLMIAVCLMLFLTLNPISTTRYAFGTAALSVAAIFGAFATPRRFRISALVLLAGLLFIFPYADYFRHTTAGGNVFARGGLISNLSSGDYDSYAQINNTLLYNHQNQLRVGRQAEGVIFFWVPRGIWSDKPDDTGTIVAENRGYGFTNLSAPLWAELLINGGWPLLAVGMAAFGYLCRRAGEIQERSSAHLGIAGSIVPFYMIIVLRGSLLQAIGGLSVILLIAWVIQGGNGPRRSLVSVTPR